MAVTPAGVYIYVNDRLSGAPALADPPVGASRMRCCGVWEEDENAVDWGSLADGGYKHWSPLECRR